MFPQIDCNLRFFFINGQLQNENIKLCGGLHHPVLFVQLVFLYSFSNQHTTINDFIFIYLSHSLRHVAGSNYGHNQRELLSYKKMYVSFAVKVQASNCVTIPSIG